MRERGGVPRLGRSLLALCVPPDEREGILGDLEEEWRARGVNRVFGHAWYWRQVVAIGLPLLAFRLHDEWARPAVWRKAMNQFFRELGQSGRALARKPGFGVAATFTLALGIGANAAIFSVVYGVLLHPLPYQEPDRVVTVWESDSRRPGVRIPVSPASAILWRDHWPKAIESVGAVAPWAVEYTGGAEPESLDAVQVSEGYFPTLGVAAALGRTFRPEEFRTGGPKVVVLSDALWKQKFNSDPAIIGRALRLGPDSVSVVGILPSDFRSPSYPGRGVYVPLVFWPGAEQARSQYLGAVARLARGASIEEAQAALAALQSPVATGGGTKDAVAGVTLVPVLDQIVGPARPAMWTLFGSAILILLIACANVAHLQLARAAERRREFAIRAALGAERGRLIGQLVTESIWLVAGASIAGGGLAFGLLRIIRTLAPTGIPRIETIGLNAPVLLAGAAVAFATLLAFSLLPVLRTALADLQPSLKEGTAGASAGPGARRLRDSLVVWEVALALVLLVGATLLTRSFVALLNVEPGFKVENVAAFQVYVYNRYDTPAEQVEYFRHAFDEVRSVPSVVAVGASSVQPFLFGAPQALPVSADGLPSPPPGQEATAGAVIAAGDYFKAAGIPVVRGREFSDLDRADGVPVAVVSDSFARKLWNDVNAVGKTFTYRSSARAVSVEVIGVVGDVHRESLDDSPQPVFYRPLTQAPTGGLSLVIATSTPIEARLEDIKRAIWRVNPGQPFYRISTVDALLERSLTQRRFLLYLLGSFAALALVLATVGIYGVISFVTGQRSREIGLRVALGATPREILSMIMSHGLRLAGFGAAVGGLAALGLSRLARSLLYGVSPFDPLAYLLAGVLLMALAAAASFMPARRAMKSNPVAVLRES